VQNLGRREVVRNTNRLGIVLLDEVLGKDRHNRTTNGIEISESKRVLRFGDDVGVDRNITSSATWRFSM
jgi:hypothetical protein